jgi:5-formyltetrahydrofolate cyclo-ligase
MRGELKAARKALGARERIAAAEGLSHQLAELPELSQPGYVAGYWAMDGEMPLHAVMPRLADGVVWCLPRLVDGKRLVFAPWRAGDPLVANRFGIPEPDLSPSSCLAPEDIGVVLAPLVGFDRLGNRLGTGGGYYDRSFAFRQHAAAPPLLVGVGYALQEVDGLQARPWDVPMDLVATESELIDCRGPRQQE